MLSYYTVYIYSAMSETNTSRCDHVVKGFDDLSKDEYDGIRNLFFTRDRWGMKKFRQNVKKVNGYTVRKNVVYRILNEQQQK